MIAVPRWRFPYMRENDPNDPDAQRLDVTPSTVDLGLFIECDITQPPSMQGRKVTLRVTPDKADAMLRAIRDYGIDRRSSSIAEVGRV